MFLILDFKCLDLKVEIDPLKITRNYQKEGYDHSGKTEKEVNLQVAIIAIYNFFLLKSKSLVC